MWKRNIVKIRNLFDLSKPCSKMVPIFASGLLIDFWSCRKCLPAPWRTNYSSVIIRTCVYQGVRNVGFSKTLACFVFLEHPFWDSPFCLITDVLKSVHEISAILCSGVFRILSIIYDGVFCENSKQLLAADCFC